jgi:MFS family permease
MVGLAQIVPVIVGSILGGTAADAVDRRRLLVFIQVLMGLTSVGFALNTGPATPLWPIFALVAANAGIAGAEGPTRTAIIPSLVPATQLPSAFALNQTLSQIAQMVGPVIAGLLIAGLGIGSAYWVSAAGALFTAFALIPLGPRKPEGASRRIAVDAMVEGWRYLRSVPLLQHIMLIDLNAMVFGMPRALFPVIGTTILGGDATTVGLLHAAPAAGALTGALTTGWVSAIRRQGRVVVYAVSVWGLAIVGFGLTRHLVGALALLAIAGGADVVSNIFRNTILQLTVPDRLRGRLTAFKVSLAAGGPRLGDAEAGAVAALATPTISVVSGGLASIVGTTLMRAIRTQADACG